MGVEKLKEQIANNVTDPRRTSHGNIRHKLVDIIIIGLCATCGNAKDYAGMEAFGRMWEDWLRTFLELPNGIPDADTFRLSF